MNRRTCVEGQGDGGGGGDGGEGTSTSSTARAPVDLRVAVESLTSYHHRTTAELQSVQVEPDGNGTSRETYVGAKEEVSGRSCEGRRTTESGVCERTLRPADKTDRG